MKCRRYILFCDEAFNSQRDLRYHHYYGGLLIDERFVDQLERTLDRLARSSGLSGELKWGKVDARSAEAYMEVAAGFFDELAQGYFRVRVLFLDRYLRPSNLIKRSRQEQFFTLYYLFVTRAFGWSVAPFERDEVLTLRFYLDQLPDAGEARSRFKRFLGSIGSTRRFEGIRLHIPEDGISEIDSRRHRIAQLVDLLIGALGFRMNRLHRTSGRKGTRGNRTRAKDRVSKAIQDRLRDFGIKNIGITTGMRGNPLAMWQDPIRLWRLEPKSFTLERRWLRKKAP